MVVYKKMPDKNAITKRMRELNVCGESQIERRASSVSGWLYWIFNLINL